MGHCRSSRVRVQCSTLSASKSTMPEHSIGPAWLSEGRPSASPEAVEVVLVVVDVRADPQPAPAAGHDDAVVRRSSIAAAGRDRPRRVRGPRWPSGPRRAASRRPSSPPTAASSRTASARSSDPPRRRHRGPTRGTGRTLAPNVSSPGMLNEPPSQRWALGLSRNSSSGALYEPTTLCQPTRSAGAARSSRRGRRGSPAPSGPSSHL